MSFGLYILGFAILITGLGIGAHLMHMPPRWIGVGVIVLVGWGFLRPWRTRGSAIRRIRQTRLELCRGLRPGLESRESPLTDGA